VIPTHPTDPTIDLRAETDQQGRRRTDRSLRRRWGADAEVAELLRCASDEDGQALAELIHRYQRLVAHVARRHGLSESAVADVSQATWMNLVRRAHAIEKPEQIVAWLSTTARRESLRHLTRAAARYEVPEGLMPVDDAVGVPGDVDAQVLAHEQQRIVRTVVGQLRGKSGDVVRLLMSEEDLSYQEVAERAGVSVGSVGPMRTRALHRIRGDRRIVSLDPVQSRT
jgi:RNA polymerase sigma factor (sigma-70 family)